MSAALYGPLLGSAITCGLLWWTKSWHGHWSLDSHPGVQKSHDHTALRVGGLGLMAGLLVLLWQLPPSQQQLLKALLLAALPAFGFGLIEDVTKRVGATVRFWLALVSGGAFCLLTGHMLTRVDVPYLDQLFQFKAVAFVFTAFAVAGVTHAINIIDGFDGLASGTVLLALAALGTVAYQLGDSELVLICLAVASATVGFMLFNFPLGKIFLGDGGAYLLGFMLAVVAVLLVVRHPEVSAWSALLACSYPVVEVLFSIYRRYKGEAHPGQPDKEHLHNLVRSVLIRRWSWLGRRSRRSKNLWVAPVLWAYALIPALLTVLSWRSQQLSVLSVLAVALLYGWFYSSLKRGMTSKSSKASAE